MDIARTAEFLAAIALKGAVIVLVALLAAAALRRQSAALRSWVWTLTFVMLALLPALTAALPGSPTVPVPPQARAPFLSKAPDGPRLLPTWFMATPPTPSDSVATISATWDTKRETLRNLQGTVSLVWAAGALVMLFRFGLGRLRAARLARRAGPSDPDLWGQHPGYDVRAAAGIATPITAGLFRPVVVVPTEPPSEDNRTTGPLAWPAEGRRAAVRHELAHVDRRDTVIACLADLMCALHWCNPLVWVAARRLRLDREIAADDAVLNAGTLSSDYAAFLVDLAARPSSLVVPGAIVPILTRAGLKARLLAILDERTRRNPPSRLMIVLAAFGCGCLVSIVATASSSTTVAAARVSAGLNPPVQPKRWQRPQLTKLQLLDSLHGASGALAGRVVTVGPGGHPASGAQVDLLTNTAEPIDWTVADANGRFRFDPLPRQYSSEMYGLYVRKGALADRRTVHVPPNKEKDLTIALGEPGRTIQGVVRGDRRQPITGVEISLTTNQGGTWRLFPGPSASQVTDAQGRYRIEGVLPADFRLRATAAGFATDERGVSIADGDTAADLQMLPLKGLEGVVVTASGQPVAGAVVMHAFHAAGTIDTTDRAVTEADGSFYIRAAGQAVLVAYHQERGLVTPNPVRVEMDDARKVRVVVGLGARVSGTVHWHDGRPAAGIMVITQDTDDQGRRFGWYDIVRTGPDGRYQVGPMGVGRYKLNFDSRMGPQPVVFTERAVRVESLVDVVDADATLPAR